MIRAFSTGGPAVHSRCKGGALWSPGRPSVPGVSEESSGEFVSRRLRQVVAPGVAEVGPTVVDDDRPGTTRLSGPNPFDPGRRGVRALALVAVLVAVVAAVLAWRARPRPEPVPAPDLGAPTVLDDPAPDGSGSARPGSTGAAQLVVAVAGKVRRPGLVRLPAGSRVADAIESAGGLLPGADVAFLNLARKVTDGELILVGVTAPPGALDAAGGPAGGPAGPAPGAGPPINLNTATLTQLDSLPGVGPVLAQRILDHRQRHGPFRSVGDLRQVDGIGEARYEQLKELVTV